MVVLVVVAVVVVVGVVVAVVSNRGIKIEKEMRREGGREAEI